MAEPIIQFTISEAWVVFLGICGGVVTIAAAVNVIIRIVRYFRRPNQTQNEEIGKLWKEMGAIKEDYNSMRQEYETYFRKDKERLDVIEKGNRVTQKALLALLSHGIDGNDIDSMKEAKKDLEEYLIVK